MYKSARFLVAMSATALSACAAGMEQQAVAPETAAPPEARGSVPTAAGVNPFETRRQRMVPLIDAHQHLMGPAAMATLQRSPAPPAITVPLPIQRLLDKRRQTVTADSFASIYTADAQHFSQEQGRWWTGKGQILDAASNFGFQWRFEPTRYSASGRSGFVSGMIRNASGAQTYDFILGLKKDANNEWRIASEMMQIVMPPIYAPSITADRTIEVLNDAGIRYATVLSVGFWFGKPSLNMTREQRIAGMRAENDWTIAQAEKYRDRLLPFCGVNPGTDYAIDELRRCAAIPAVRGIKLHRRNSRIEVSDAATLKQVQDFFRTANDLKMPVVIHLADDPRLWIDHVFPLAPDIPIQIAHMGSGWSITRLFADAIQAGKPGTSNLWFDWTQADPVPGLWGYGPSAGLSGTLTPAQQQEHADIMRRLGLGRILYGSDMALAWNPTPREWWRKTILTLPLTDDEIADIADNLPPYAKCHRVCAP